MKTVFPGKQLAHIWAQQNQETGKNNNGQFYFTGRTIYSYGSHFPIATFIRPGVVLFTSDSYSSTTAKHISYARSAIPGGVRVVPVPGGVLRAAVYHNPPRLDGKAQPLSRSHAPSTEKTVKQALTAYYSESIVDSLDQAARAKKDYMIQMHRESADTMRGHAEFIAANFKGCIDLKKVPNPGTFDRAAWAETLKKQEAAQRKAQAREIQEAIKAFRAGENKNTHLLPETLMRIQGDEVVTSKGARFPVAHARRAWRELSKVRAKFPGELKPGAGPADAIGGVVLNIALGSFRIDAATPAGVKAGCHFVKWPEIERMAAQLGVA